MISNWETMPTVSHSCNPHGAILARMIMAKDETDIETGEEKSSLKDTIKQDWESGKSGKAHGVLFKPEELDIYANKATLEAYIFHSKKIDYQTLDRLEYDHEDNSVIVVKKDGTRLDLGVKIQWLIRPYLKKAEEINIVQTKDGKSVDGINLPLIHKNKEK